jgi:hypothetical protein
MNKINTVLCKILFYLFLFFVSTKVFAQTWSSPETIAFYTNSPLGSSIAIGSNNDWHIVYGESVHDGDLFISTIKHISINSGTTILAQETYNNSTGQGAAVEHPSIVSDSQDKLHVIYNFYDEVLSIKYINNVSGSWSTPETIAIYENSPTGSSIAIDSNNDWHIVYSESVINGNINIYTIKHISNNSGTTIIAQETYNNSTGQGAGVEDPAIASDSEDKLHVIYNFYDEVLSIKYIYGEPEYVLKRESNGDFEEFDLFTHAWSFANDSSNMWPQAWWQQFDYRGDDPYTQKPYPFYFIKRYFAKRSDFPDWPLFVDAFGVSQCYTSEMSYRPQALKVWRRSKGNWGGSCFGFAISSLLSFHHESEFISKFPGINWGNNLHSLNRTPERARIINHLWTHQFGYLSDRHLVANWSKKPDETLKEIKQMLYSHTSEDDRVLSFWDSDKPSGHTVIPYKVEQDQSDPDIEWIYIYDNNAPNNVTRKIRIDKDQQSYSYGSWGGNKKFFLELPIAKFLSTPILPNYGVNNNDLHPITTFTENQFIEIYNTPNAFITIIDSIGNSIGFIDSTVFSDLNDGIPIIPTTGYFHPPVGYYVRDGEYSAQIYNFSDSTSYFSVYDDSHILSYNRSDADDSQVDNIYFKNDLSIYNEDMQVKSINLEVLIFDNNDEKYYVIESCEMFQYDSLNLDVVNNDNIKLLNSGQTKTYNLTIVLASDAASDIFEHSNIELTSNSTHQIVPDWDDLVNQPVLILIDIDNNGSFDDTLYVQNQYTGLDEDIIQSTLPGKYYLFQNYPNPFNPVTKIKYQISELSFVTLRIYDVLGREITTLVNEENPAGEYEIEFDASALTSGIYFYSLHAGSFVETKKMILMK